ncbi:MULTISPECIES: YkgJ family cysteine cluster protein [Methylomonas]|uniref:YkgJ family cysteine cluster protein n=1 Tax=Methylomonas TaxID=416 RepID=UPI001E49F00B|nr:YkgJ family cysteine cluster protein [Methylomonas rhizoryzae]
MNESDYLGFFAAQHQAFADTLAVRRGQADLIDGLLSLAFSSFDGNVEAESANHPPIACHKGCATCCTLRVTASAPEVLLVARFIRWQDQRDPASNLGKRVIKANQTTVGLDEAARVKLRKTCPFIRRGACGIYPVRPLACRGHACYDKRACNEAAAGRIAEIPLSYPHRNFRSLIQNALQSALRDAGYVWDLYELNRAVSLALQQENSESAWQAGMDPFAEAVVNDIGREEMARTFDTLKRYQA